MNHNSFTPIFAKGLHLFVIAALATACNSPTAPRALPQAPGPEADLNVSAETTPQTRMEQAFGQLPLYFVENQGQMDERVAYYIQGSDKTLYFTPEGVTFALTRPATDESPLHHKSAFRDSSFLGDAQEREARDASAASAYSRWAVKLDFVGANPDVRPLAQDETEAVISYFKGQPDEWQTGLHTYSRLVYPDLWPGIDLAYYGTVNQLKYEFIVEPGADPAQIRLAYRGATDVRLNESGQMEVSTPLGGFADDRPVAYQDIDGQRVGVAIAYTLDEGKDDPADRLLARAGDAPPGRLYSFRVGDYDPTRPLVLDPAVLVYAGYIGGSGNDRGYSIAVDGAGNAYVTGDTTSDQTAGAFPEMGGPDLTFNGVRDAFVAKVNAAGTALVYAGYIGGAGGETGTGIAVDGAGNAYVTGGTASDETAGAFPVTIGPDLTFNGGDEAFVAKVNAAGTALVYAGYIGGVGDDFGGGIAVDSAGNAYITGGTVSDETAGAFPVTVGPDLTYNGVRDAFVAKVNAAGTALVYAGYLGGAGDDTGRRIAVDGAGNAYVTGDTQSDETAGAFPVTGGPDLTFNGGSDAFVAKVNAAGTAPLVYAGYIGGAGNDRGYGIAVDGVGNAYVTGQTASDQTTFPVTIGPDLTYNGGGSDADVFIAKVNAAGTAPLVYAGYIGGAGDDYGIGIALDSAGNAYVTGYTRSDQTTFPVTVGPDLTYNGGFYDAFVAKVNAAGTALVYAGYIGGSDSDYGGNGITVDSAGNAYVTGYTVSDQATFPAKGGPDLTFNGGDDAFVAKVPPISVDAYVSAPALIGARPAGAAAIPIQYGNHGTITATSVTLTATLGISLTYLSDTSGFTPTVVSNTVTWSLPNLGFTNMGQFTLFVTVPSAPFGDRYPIALALSSAGPEDNGSDNLVNMEVMIARQVFLPLVRR